MVIIYNLFFMNDEYKWVVITVVIYLWMLN